MLDYFELPCAGTPRLLMVWLHGLGADGYDLEPVAEMLALEGVRHVFPHAPVRPVTLNGGMAMRAWYDIATPNLQWKEDREGMQASARQVQDLIETLRQDSGIPVVLAGFSQGAVISLVTAAAGLPGLIGVLAMSGYAPEFLARMPDSLRAMPVLMMHGEQDEIVPIALGKAAYDRLSVAGADAVWHAYAMPHAICQQEILDAARWLKRLAAGLQ